MRIFVFLFGLILLLPGACALGFLFMSVSALPSLGSGDWRDPGVWGVIGIATVGWGLCFLISFGGILMMRAALNPQPPGQIDGEPGPNDAPPSGA